MEPFLDLSHDHLILMVTVQSAMPLPFMQKYFCVPDPTTQKVSKGLQNRVTSVCLQVRYMAFQWIVGMQSRNSVVIIIRIVSHVVEYCQDDGL